MVRNTKTGEIKIKKRPADQLDEEMKAALKARKRGEVDDEGNATAKKKRQNQAEKPMSKDERRRLVKEMMAKKREDKAAAAAKCVEYKQDVVAFGEVTHGPPTLVTPRRAQKAETVARVSVFYLIWLEFACVIMLFLFSPATRRAFCCIQCWTHSKRMNLLMMIMTTPMEPANRGQRRPRRPRSIRRNRST